MTSRTKEKAQLAEQAAEWVMRLEDEPTPECHAELVNWLRLSPRHIEEFLLAQATYRAFHELGPQHDVEIEELLTAQAGNIVAIASNAGRPVTPAKESASRRAWRPVAMAASLAVIAIAAGIGFLTQRGGDGIYATAVGEQRTVRLDDGSLLSLNTHSKAQVLFSGNARRVNLLEGDALFDVARDPSRPFQVSAGSAVIEVLGTQFNVQRRNGKTRVSVVDGRVRINASEAAEGVTPTVLSAGDEAHVTRGQVIKQATADLESALAWRQRRLVFRGTPLSEVVEEFNRYNERQIRLEDEALAQRRISGVFHADDPGTILKFLRKESAVTIEDRAGEIVIRER